jgi:hypothetical protein
MENDIIHGIVFFEDNWYIEYQSSGSIHIIEICYSDVDYINKNPYIQFMGLKVSFTIIEIENKKFARFCSTFFL